MNSLKKEIVRTHCNFAPCALRILYRKGHKFFVRTSLGRFPVRSCVYQLLMLTTLLLCILLVCGVMAQQGTELQRLYASTNGSMWTNNTNWGTGDPCVNHWFGITCVAGNVVQMYTLFLILFIVDIISLLLQRPNE